VCVCVQVTGDQYMCARVCLQPVKNQGLNPSSLFHQPKQVAWLGST